MTESPSLLLAWMDRDFWTTGSFLCLEEMIILGKGGDVTRANTFLSENIPAFYLKDFFTNEYLIHRPEKTLMMRKSHFGSILKCLPENHGPIHPMGNDDDLYEKDYQLLGSKFGRDLEKVVLISRESYSPFEQDQTVRRLFRKAFEFGTGTPYGFWNHHYGVIGSTPELLFDLNGNNLSTFALAGTARAGEEEKLLQSEKDRHEHNLVIRNITESLAPFCQKLEVQKTQTSPYRSMIHLKTNIDAELKTGVSVLDLTNALSPTAALGGYPKELACRFLRQSHYGLKYPERYFGSAFGIVGPDVKRFVVSIRNVQWMEQEIFIESGGGVVKESVHAKELDEIHLKRETIRKHYL